MLKSLLLVSALVVFPALVWADPQGVSDFQPFNPADHRAEVSAPLHVVLAYSLIWLILLVFVISVWRRQRKAEKEIERLASLIRK